MSLKEDFKQKKYQLVFDNLAKQCGGKPYGLYSWDFYYYVASGFFLEKEEITRDFIKGFFESIKSSNRSELDLRADNFIRGIYLRLLKKEHDLNGKLDYSYQARYVKQLFEAACFLEREDKSIESQFFMEYLVIDFVNGHLKSNRNESLDSQVLALLNLFDFSYFSSEP